MLGTLYYNGDSRADVRLANAFVSGEFNLRIHIPLAMALLTSAAQKGSRAAEMSLANLKKQVGLGLIHETDLYGDDMEAEQVSQQAAQARSESNE